MNVYSLLRSLSGAVHVVNAHDWEKSGCLPRTRCGLRIGDRWVTVASTSDRTDIARTDCCERCKPGFNPHQRAAA